MFTGDNVLGHGTSAVEELGRYMETLRKLQSHQCVKGYPAHGDVIPNLRAKIAGELAAKTRREKQCLAALTAVRRRDRSASVTVSELVDEIHGGHMDEDVRKRALEPFMDEVLRKLTEDGKVAFRVRKGEKKWFVLNSGWA